MLLLHVTCPSSLPSTCAFSLASICLSSSAKLLSSYSSSSSSLPSFWSVFSQLIRSMVLARKGLVLKEAQNYSSSTLLLGAFDWWKDIDESEDWQGGIYYTLCAAYGLVSLVALVQLLRIHLRVPEYGWTTQKVFHLMNFLVNGLRALIFGLYKSVLLIRPEAFEMVLMDLPGLLFFSTYTLLVLFWAEIYNQARSLPTNKLRPVYYVTNGFIYFTQVCIWIFIRLSQSSAAVEAANLFFSIISFCAALGFLLYGGRLFVMLRRFPIESRGRQKKIYEVGCVTGICCTCFLVRCFVLALAAFDEDADVNVLDHPILNLIFYMLVEILPSALVLFILRKLPPRRVSDQYHPIK